MFRFAEEDMNRGSVLGVLLTAPRLSFVIEMSLGSLENYSISHNNIYTAKGLGS